MTDTERLAKARAIATDPRCYREWYITDEDGEEYPVSGFNVPGLEDLIYAGLREAEALGQAEAEAQRDKLKACRIGRATCREDDTNFGIGRCGVCGTRRDDPLHTEYACPVQAIAMAIRVRE